MSHIISKTVCVFLFPHYASMVGCTTQLILPSPRKKIFLVRASAWLNTCPRVLLTACLYTLIAASVGPFCGWYTHFISFFSTIFCWGVLGPSSLSTRSCFQSYLLLLTFPLLTFIVALIILSSFSSLNYECFDQKKFISWPEWSQWICSERIITITKRFRTDCTLNQEHLAVQCSPQIFLIL